MTGQRLRPSPIRDACPHRRVSQRGTEQFERLGLRAVPKRVDPVTSELLDAADMLSEIAAAGAEYSPQPVGSATGVFVPLRLKGVDPERESRTSHHPGELGPAHRTTHDRQIGRSVYASVAPESAGDTSTPSAPRIA